MENLNSEILVLLINLDRAEERRLKMERQLSGLGIDYVRISARQYSVFPSPVSIGVSGSFIDTYGRKSLKFPWYKRTTTFFYRVYTQLSRFAHFHTLLKNGSKTKHVYR